MTAGNDDVWTRRRQMGEILRRWATPAPSDRPPTAQRPGVSQPLTCQPPELSQPAALLAWLRSVLCRWPRRAPRDRGAATIFVMAMGLVLVLMGMAGAAIGAARVGRHRAQAAADLGALAGAARVVEGAGAACRSAARFVTLNGGRAASCEVSGLEIVVRTEVVVTPLPGLTRHATAAARAGPVYAPGF